MEGCARHLTDIEDAFSELIAELDPDAVALCEAPNVWEQFAHMRRLADTGMTLLARRVDEAGKWRREGFRSAAEQMAAKAGSSVSSAKSMLQTSERVKEQPKTAQAMRSGELSGAKALVAAAWVTYMDNLSAIQNWFSDALCCAVTGGGAPYRRLYTDDDLHVVKIKRPIMISGIDLGAIRDDLADRTLTIPHDVIPSEQRRSEKDLNAAWDEARAQSRRAAR